METTQWTILKYRAETYMETCHIAPQNSTVTKQAQADLKKRKLLTLPPKADVSSRVGGCENSICLW